MALSKITFFCVALALLLGGAKSQLLSGDECPPKTGDTFYIGVLGDPIMFMASWIATEHAINNNGLAAKPSIGCFDFDIHVFTGDGPSDEITCYKDPEYRFKTDYDIDAGAFGGVPLEELGCDDLCFPENSIRYDTNCQASRGEPGAHEVVGYAADNDSDIIAAVGAGCSGPSTMATPALNTYGIPIVSPSSTSGRLSDIEKYPNFFRTAAGDDGQAVALLDFAKNSGIKKAAVIATRDAFSQSFLEGIVRFAPNSGIDIVAQELVCQDTACGPYYDEVYAAMQRIKDSGVKVIFSTSHCVNARLIREIGYLLGMTQENCYMWISGDASAVDDCWDKLSTESAYDFHDEFVPKQADLGYHGTNPRGGSGDIYKDFIGFWAAQDKCTFPGAIHKDGVFDVEMFSSETYDAVLAIAMAIKKVREDGGEATRASVMAKLDEDDFTFQGATGIVSFGGNFIPPIGDHDRPPVYDLMVFEGKWIRVGYWSPLDIFTVNIFMPLIYVGGQLAPPACIQEP